MTRQSICCLWVFLTVAIGMTPGLHARLDAADPEADAAQTRARFMNTAKAAEELTGVILQRKDAAGRRRALQEVLEKLGGDATAKVVALATLSSARDVPFDRSSFLGPVRLALRDADPAVRAGALMAIAGAGGTAKQLSEIAALAEDVDGFVRAQVPGALYGNGGAEHPDIVHPVIEKLLGDQWKDAKRAAVRSLWGCSWSPRAEEMLIELSRDPVLSYDTIYYALSTHEGKSRPVCDRLIEALEHRDPNVRWRAAWGLSYFTVAPDAREHVLAALIKALDDDLNATVRDYCVHGLGTIGSDAAVSKLRDLATNDESRRIREAAAQELRRVGAMRR